MSLRRDDVLYVSLPFHHNNALSLGWAAAMGAGACMAALTLAVLLEQFDGNALADHLQQQLPSYAVPLFLRVRDAHEVTATFKNRKVELKNEGFDLDTVSDPVFWLAGPQQGYQRLDAATLTAIRSGTRRL